MSIRFIHEIRAYELLAEVGLAIDQWGVVKDQQDLATLPFEAGQGIVVKGTAIDVWHKSDLGLVKFDKFSAETVWSHHETMKAAAASHGAYVGTLVARMVDFKKVSGMPCEALVALRKTADAGWTIVLGIGGILTNAWGEEIRPLLWPVALTTPEQALAEFKAHWLGKTWLGTMRQGKALTDETRLMTFFQGLWRLVDLLEQEGATLLEMNPLVLDETGRPIALDGVGTCEPLAMASAASAGLAPEQLFELLVQPRTIALAGISAREGTPGRMILDNLLRSTLGPGSIIPIKPGEKEISGLPCLNGIEDLAQKPVDMLILCLPAAQTVQAIEQLCAQGGGAQVVYLVPGGVGDGADTEGRGKRVTQLLEDRRRQGLWTPALVGPNGLGFLSSEGNLNTLFIPEVKLPFMAKGGSLSLVSQSGAFLITRLSCAPQLPLRYGVSIGGQIDVRLSDFIAALGKDEQTQVVATYVEGFQPGDLLATAQAAQELARNGKWVVMYKGGRSAEGQAAASSHTGALAGDWELQKALLKRAGVIVCERMETYDAVLAWLSAHPKGKPSRVAVMTNAGYESVVSADLLESPLQGHHLEAAEAEHLKALLVEHKLQELVAAHLPLDLTPMADEQAYLASARLVARSAADTLVVGLVPLTMRLETWDGAKMQAFAEAMALVATESGKRLGVVVEAGPIFEPYRQALQRAGLPVFSSMERALQGLKALAER